jgi:hypothetical protein
VHNPTPTPLVNKHYRSKTTESKPSQVEGAWLFRQRRKQSVCTAVERFLYDSAPDTKATLLTPLCPRDAVSGSSLLKVGDGAS